LYQTNIKPYFFNPLTAIVGYIIVICSAYRASYRPRTGKIIKNGLRDFERGENL